MIKLIVSDVDDTLVPERSIDLNPEYFTVIRQLQDRGILFVGASGRPVEGVKIAFSPIKEEIYYIGDNGTHIQAGECTCTRKIENQDYKALARELQTLDREYDFMPCLPGKVYVHANSGEFKNFLSSYGFALTEVENLSTLKDITKVSLYHDGGVPSTMRETLRSQWGDKMDGGISGRVWLDFTAKGSNKGSALALIQDYYGIKPEETVVFGNADNDIPMFRKAKYSYSVAGASASLKKEAYEVIGAMEEDAVLDQLKEILEELLMEEKRKIAL